MNGLRDGSGDSRDCSGGNDVPVIAMTAHHDDAELRRCREVGCTTVIQKPLSRKELNAVVARHLKPRVPDGLEPVEEAAPATEEEEHVVWIDPDIQDLVPRFLENQANNAELALQLSASGDFESIRRIGHNMKGTGKGYGFEVISSCGATLEQAAAKAQTEAIEEVAREIGSYIAQVRWQPRG